MPFFIPFFYTGMIHFSGLNFCSRVTQTSNPGPTKANNNNVPLNAFPFYNCNVPTIPPEWDSSDCNKKHDDSKWNIFKKRLVYFTYECQ